MKGFIRLKTLCLAALAFSAAVLLLAEPAWWSTRELVDHAKPADDYAVLNQGQLKNFVRAARDEMNDKLPGGAGTVVNSLVASWSTTDTNASNYDAVNIGQLKAMATVIYDRLAEYRIPHGAPWTQDTVDDDNYALANIGQAKMAFDFLVPGDSNNNGINDAWEWRYWNGLDHNMALDSDGDGISDGDEILAGTDPFQYNSGGNGTNGSIIALRVFNPLRQ